MGLHICWGKCPASPPEPPKPPEPMPQAPQPRWNEPAPFGLAPARQSMASGAAALLAGFSAALVGVVAQDPEKMRYPGWTFLALTLAAIVLVACVQCGFNARSLLYSHAEITEWRPTPWTPEQTTDLRKSQKRHAIKGRRWEWAAEWTFHIGILCLALGIALILIPMACSGESTLRWIAAYLIAGAGVLQLLHFLIVWTADRKARQSHAQKENDQGQAQ